MENRSGKLLKWIEYEFIGIKYKFYDNTYIRNKTKNKIRTHAVKNVLLKITEARIIGVMRLANKKENGKYAVLLVTLGANARSADRVFAVNASRGSNGSELVCFNPSCAPIGWRSFDRWKRMKVVHVLKQSSLFKPNLAPELLFTAIF